MSGLAERGKAFEPGLGSEEIAQLVEGLIGRLEDIDKAQLPVKTRERTIGILNKAARDLPPLPQDATDEQVFERYRECQHLLPRSERTKADEWAAPEDNMKLTEDLMFRFGMRKDIEPSSDDLEG